MFFTMSELLWLYLLPGAMFRRGFLGGPAWRHSNNCQRPRMPLAFCTTRPLPRDASYPAVGHTFAY